MFYTIHIPWWVKKLYAPTLVWDIPAAENSIFLTFDDGPHETATPFILDQLKKYQAKATFFCIGKNVEEHPLLYKQILEEGHKTGNHTQNHLNGWKTETNAYLTNIREAEKHIQSNLFRPPYGRIRKEQIKMLTTPGSEPSLKNPGGYKIIMWNVLSGDFDERLSKEKCLDNVLKHTKSGSIVVFHDSSKAWDRMQYALPGTLEHFSRKGYVFRAIG